MNRNFKAFLKTPKGKLLLACAALLLSWIFLLLQFSGDLSAWLPNESRKEAMNREIRKYRAEQQTQLTKQKAIDALRKRCRDIVAAGWQVRRDGDPAVLLRQKIETAAREVELPLENIGSVRTTGISSDLYFAEMDLSTSAPFETIVRFLGKVRDLRPSEILDQVLFTQLDSGKNISNIVLMGIGEPLDNLDNVLRFLELVNHPQGLNIGMRHISLSTCGILPGIRRLGELGLQLTLSVSLHAPDSETRSRIMPVNRAYDVDELFKACHEYFQRTGRRISFEYAMIDGVNDHDWQADMIAAKLRGMPGHVNLIPLNDVAESPLKPSRRVRQFQQRLEGRGVTATVRRSLGGDIDASCGQLRRKAMEDEKKENER